MIRVTLEQVSASAPHKRAVLGILEIVGAPEKDAETLAPTDFYAVVSGDAAGGRKQSSFRSPTAGRWGVWRVCLEAIRALRLDLLER